MAKSTRPKDVSPYDWIVLNSIVMLNGCREWQGCLDSNGYGKMWVGGGRTERAHRIVAAHHFGPPPTDRPCVLHSCDNPLCVEITHLRYGTHAENAADRERRGRGRPCYGNHRGSTHAFAKLSDDDVRAIRDDPRTQRVIAAEYKISQSAVSKIKRRITWKHLRDGHDYGVTR